MKALPNDEYLKRMLISRYLWPSLGLDAGVTATLTKDFAALSRPIAVTRHEVLEQPGSYHDGYLYWFEQALAHTYYTLNGQPFGLAIHGWQQPVLNASSVLYKDERYACVEALEDGGALRISYPSLYALMHIYPMLKGTIENLAEKQESGEKTLHAQRQLPPFQRYQLFIDQHADILHRLTHRVQAMHAQVGEQYIHYYNDRLGRQRSSYRTY